MESSKFREILFKFFVIGEKPKTKESLLKLSTDLSKISKEEIGKDEDNRYKVIRLIQTFGVNEKTSHEELTVKQWRRLREVISKVLAITVHTHSPVYLAAQAFEAKPRKYNVNLPELDEEVTSVIMNLVNDLSSNVLSSAITVPVLEYFELISVLTEGSPEKQKKLKPIESVLKSHGWTSGGFTSPPDRLLILKDLENLLTKGLDEYRKLPEEPVRIIPPKKMTSQEKPLENDLLIEIIETLIQAIQSQDFAEAESSFETLSDLISTEESVPVHLQVAINQQREAPDWDLLVDILKSFIK